MATLALGGSFCRLMRLSLNPSKPPGQAPRSERPASLKRLSSQTERTLPSPPLRGAKGTEVWRPGVWPGCSVSFTIPSLTGGTGLWREKSSAFQFHARYQWPGLGWSYLPGLLPRWASAELGFTVKPTARLPRGQDLRSKELWSTLVSKGRWGARPLFGCRRW